MAATISKDSAPTRVPPSPHLSIPVVPGGASPIKSGHQRHPSIGTSSSSSFASHRVTRRKSMSATSGANVALVAQAMKEVTESQMAFDAAAAAQNGVVGAPPSMGKIAEKDVGMHGYPSPPSSLPTPGPLGISGLSVPTVQLPRKGAALLNGSAIVDGHAPDMNRGGISRNRRASEGAASALGVKGGRGRSTSELKCDKCGKGYKHSSCLTKHLWEHTPEWSYTSKLLISKHQQVQLLEAASILVSMNPTPPASSSGASNNEGHSSASSSDETTPPPNGLVSPLPTPRGIRNGAGKPGKRYSNSGSISKSYNGSSSSGLLAGSAPTYAAFPNHIPQRPPPRPRSGSNVSGVRGPITAPSPHLHPAASTEDDALAAAVELLSCSFHTPKMTPAMPVGSAPRGGLSDMGSPPAGGRSYVGPLNDVMELKKEEGEYEDVDMDGKDDDEERWSRRGRSEEDEDGVFGRMEE